MAPVVGLAAAPLLGLASKAATDPVGTAKKALQLSIVIGGPAWIFFAIKGRAIAKEIEEGTDRTFDAAAFEFGSEAPMSGKGTGSSGGSNGSSSGGGAEPKEGASQEEVAAYWKPRMIAAGLPPVLAVMTSLVESNMATGESVRFSDLDSAGPFQIRVDLHGWTIEDAESYRVSLDEWFIPNAKKYVGQFSATATGYGQWCQTVQGSAYPDRYAERHGEAMGILAKV